MPPAISWQGHKNAVLDQINKKKKMKNRVGFEHV
jgi:hypothetical protein